MYMSNTQKRNRAKIEFEKDFYKLLNNAFLRKMLEKIRNGIKLELIKEDDNEKVIEQQSKLLLME